VALGPLFAMLVKAENTGAAGGLSVLTAAEVLDALPGRYGSLQPFRQIAATVPRVAPCVAIRDCLLLLAVGIERLRERRERNAEFVHAMANPADQTFARFSVKPFNRRGHGF
jgi:hypothetical protein